MDSSCFLVYRIFRFRKRNKNIPSSLPPSSPPSSLSQNWLHPVFLSFRGEDVRKGFLSHIQKEFQRMGITPFIDNEMKRGGSIGPELLQAIRGSKIAIILLSRNYGSSKWCLDELVEIMKCREELGQTVMTVFYDVDPSDVRKQKGDFGKVFRKTCVGRPEEVKQKWKQALTSAANILGEDSRNWENEADMIIKIAKDVSDVLSFTPSKDFDEFVGIEAHTTEITSLLQLDLEEVRMIGIWGPAGIGKTTISRVLYNKLFHQFQLGAIIDNIKVRYPRPCHDEYSAKLQLQKELLSQMINQKDMVVPHLGVAQERLKDRKVLLVLDDVDALVQLDAMAKDVRWFGLGSRIIVVTQDLKLLKAHGIKYIYKVDFPTSDEALEIFCMYAFGQKSPKVGFEQIARTVTTLAGKLPLGLRVMGSYLRRMSKQEWARSIPRLRTSLDDDIESVLKFSYNSLAEEEKDLFLHIACFFRRERIETLEVFLANKFGDVKQGLQILADKSLLSLNFGNIEMHNLLVQLGLDIIRKQSIHKPGKRQFLVDAEDICEVLTEDTGTRTLVGIDLELSGVIEGVINISERAFERMCNLQFLRFHHPYGDRCHDILYLPQGLSNISRKLRLLHWERYPLTCLPSKFNPEFLVKINMRDSMLEKLWEGNEPIRNLKWMDLSFCVNLKELPDFSTATNLQELRLVDCLSLVELPSSIGNVTNLLELDLIGCSSLVKLPSSIGNLTNLKKLYLNRCSSLVQLPSSIGNVTSLKELNLSGCSSLLEIPSSIGNTTNLKKLYADGCSSLVELPSSVGNIANLRELQLMNCSSLIEFPSSILKLTRLKDLNLSGCSSLVKLPSIGNVINLQTLFLSGCSSLVELPFSIENATNLQTLYLNGCSDLLELPSSIWNITNLQSLYLNGCSSLKELPSLVGNAINLQSLSLMNCSSMVELPSSIWNATNLSYLDVSSCSSLVGLNIKLELNQCRKLVSHPVVPDSLILDAGDCESLVERLDCSFQNPKIVLNFANCFKLNQEARDLIIQTSTCRNAILPGGKVPAYFTYRATGDSLTVKLNERYLLKSLRFKACLLLVEGQNKWPHWGMNIVTSREPNGYIVLYTPSSHLQGPLLMENLYTFEFELVVTSSEFVVEFRVDRYKCANNHIEIKDLVNLSCRTSTTQKHQF
ncbi:disease resistance protein TAO1 isoform X4 [Arabidopsis lyrata subsp. lyrata]|uniref:disease resistance protein TAO1 isoform X4 n=1 Tax=Arabidopsis lyrata subsp. lyrata TaxID=81972 RepID=UPI000A29B367|nr:disease resistance protein TAO1 isoform X4 [Arabidopsis lyrata subsp. lyrata]|eukprot:XP_020882189.1 disease resistance protein TAO1 isoform X4 [Arabidopsis lyrata subsp. lyrata]